MSDEAFARRFYSDRAELIALGVPLQSQRDEFTGEELYTLRSEQLLPAAARARRRRARGAPDRALPARGQVRVRGAAAARAPEPRARPRRLRRGADRHRRARRGARPRLLARDAGPPRQARERRSRSSARCSSTTGRSTRDERRRAHAQPVRAPSGQRPLVRRRPRPRPRGHPHLPRLAHPRRDPLRDAARARLPHAGRLRHRRATAAGRRGRSATRPARRGSRCSGDTAWWVERAYGRPRPARGRRLRHRLLEPRASSPRGCCGRTGARCRVAPDELRARGRARRSGASARRTRAAAPSSPREAPARRRRRPRRAARPGPVAPERFGRPPGAARVPARRLRRGREADDPGARARRALPRSRADSSRSTSRCSTSSTSAAAATPSTPSSRGDEVHVDKELFGDTFRAPPRLTPLEARAIRLALEFVGPMIAADAHTPLDRVRRKLEETFGEFELAQTPEPHVARAEEELVATLTEAIRERRLVEIEYLKEGEETPSTRLVEPYALERELPYWYVHTWDRTRDGAALLPPRPDAQRAACRRALRAARGLRAAPARASAHARTYPLPARGRALGGRARRAAARGRLGVARACRSAARTGSSARSFLPRRGGRARAGRAPRHDRRARARARGELVVRRLADPRRSRPAARARTPRPPPGADSTASVPPCASAIERAMKSPRPVPGFVWRRLATRPNFSKISALVLGGDARARGRATSTTMRPSSGYARTSTSSPAGEYLTALSIRFESTWRSRARSPRIRGSGRRDLGADAHLVLADLGGRDRVVHERGEVDVRERVAERPGLDPRGVEDVADPAPRAGSSRADQARGTPRAARGRAPASAAWSVCAAPITAAIGLRSSCETSETKSARSAESRRSSSTVRRSAS